ncbi:hypothetical protein [Paenibacillus sp. GCM10012306]|uniref:hypothetical protein n=1 Tax=Paenibacillus sp. GCM10012306 TaxID=3317342 RepID=UPI0036199E08
MFPKNLNSVEEDHSKKRMDETQIELLKKPKKGVLRQLTNTLLAAILVVGVLFLFLWIMDTIRY